MRELGAERRRGEDGPTGADGADVEAGEGPSAVRVGHTRHIATAERKGELEEKGWKRSSSKTNN